MTKPNRFVDTDAEILQALRDGRRFVKRKKKKATRKRK